MVCQDLDLCPETDFLTSVDAHCAVFLGCHMEGPALDHVLETGGIVSPRLQDFLALPYEGYGTRLYTLPDLMEGLDVERPGSFFGDTVDGRIYTRFHKFRENGRPIPVLDAFAQRLHDDPIDDVLNDFLEWQDSRGSDGEGVVLYRLPRPAPDGRTVIRLSPLELLDRLAALVARIPHARPGWPDHAPRGAREMDPTRSW